MEDKYTLVEEAISALAFDPILARKEKAGQWNLTIKDATVWIDIFNFPSNPEKSYIQVMSPLVKMPELNKEDFFIDIAEINYLLYNVSICKKDNWMYVMHLRETDGLDTEEIIRAINRVSAYSTEYYAKLSFKYKNSWIVKPNESLN